MQVREHQAPGKLSCLYVAATRLTLNTSRAQSGAAISGQENINKNQSLEEDGGGDGGIRTLDTLLRYAALAKRCLQPLGHVSS